MRQVHGVQPFKSDDPDTERIWWREVGVNQNLTFPVNPDPVSGMHCWHQKVRVTKAGGSGPLRRHQRRHEEELRALQAMARDDEAGPRPR